MTDWTDHPPLSDLPHGMRLGLAALRPMHLPRGTAIFHPGEAAKGFAVVLSGRIDVFLMGPNGRDILLYAVAPGQSCVQTTLGPLGDEDYTGEAVTGEETELVLFPRGQFLTLMNSAPAFRAFVFQAFAARLHSMMHVLERVAFTKVESRLASALVDIAQDGIVTATQAELASRVGTAREVISRRLDAFQRAGWVVTERGHVRILDPAALRQLAVVDDGSTL